MVANAKGRGTHITIVHTYYSPVSVTNFGALLFPQRWSDRNKKYIAACALIGNGVLLLFSLITRKEFQKIGKNWENSQWENALKRP